MSPQRKGRALSLTIPAHSQIQQSALNTNSFVRIKPVHLCCVSTMSAKEKPTKSKDARFDTRLPEDQKAMFEKAAILGGYRNLSDFVVTVARERALEIIAEKERLLASEEDAAIFVDALLNPPAPNNALIQAASEYLYRDSR